MCLPHTTQDLLPRFLESVPGASCAKGGVGAYSTALAREGEEPGEGAIRGLDGDGVVAASHFRAYYTPLGSQVDFIGALASVRR